MGDVNDVTPTFDKAQYHADVMENEREEQLVLHLQADDGDLGKFFYFLSLIFFILSLLVALSQKIDVSDFFTLFIYPFVLFYFS